MNHQAAQLNEMTRGVSSHDSMVATQDDGTCEAVQRDKLLTLARRLDWWFLLPEKEYRDVGFLATGTECHRQSLLRSLTQLHGAPQILSTAPTAAVPTEQVGQYDLVVVQTTQLHAVQQATEMLKPGGVLYWEVDRGRSWRWRNLEHPVHFARWANQWQLTDVSIHWHRPTFESCLEMIPLDDGPAMRFALRQRKGIKALGGRILMQLRLVPRIARCISVVASKPLEGQVH